MVLQVDANGFTEIPTQMLPQASAVIYVIFSDDDQGVSFIAETKRGIQR